MTLTSGSDFSRVHERALRLATSSSSKGYLSNCTVIHKLYGWFNRYVGICRHMYTHTHVHACTHTVTYTHTYVHACTHTVTDTHISRVKHEGILDGNYTIAISNSMLRGAQSYVANTSHVTLSYRDRSFQLNADTYKASSHKSIPFYDCAPSPKCVQL